MRVVVKIGTSSVTDGAGLMNASAIAGLCDQVAALRARGDEVIVVSSGAVAGGVGALGMHDRPTDTLTLQALAAVGQSRLMARYDEEFARHGLIGAQVLLVPHDFADRGQYLHARSTLERLLELGCVPVVNENDAVAADEIRFGDNDHLAALVAHAVDADVLVLLTDVDGLYDRNPTIDATAGRIEVVEADDPMLGVDAGGRGTDRGSGGMASKLAAARIASWSGVRAVIAAARRPDVVRAAVDGEPGVGTQFRARGRGLSARKLWIAFASQVTGTVIVDDGARTAIRERGGSLLHAGVVEVRGDFVTGDTIEVRGLDDRLVARGTSTIDAVQAGAAAGRQSSDLPVDVPAELVHRDDLVVVDDI